MRASRTAMDETGSVADHAGSSDCMDSRMSERIALVVHGAGGRMGQAILRLAAGMPDVQVTSALVRAGSPLEGHPIVGTLGTAPDITYRAELDERDDAGVILDVAGPGAFDAALALARSRGCAFVSGSTGLGEASRAALDEAAASIPVLLAANFSLGVAVLAHLSAQAAKLLGAWDCEILEAHHRHKRDAPSGTALLLGERVSRARNGAEAAPIDRNGVRVDGQIGYAALRGGDVVGEHAVWFAGDAERLELVHRATNRDVFAHGALAAARWLAGKPAGRYTMDDVLGLTRD